MNHARRARLGIWAASGLMMLVVSATAMAQAAPTPPDLRPIPAWIGYMLAFILFAAVVAVSLMPSKRSHQE